MKGLGEMNADELRETTMQAGTRRLTRIKVEDAKAAAKKLQLYHGKGKYEGGKAEDARREWVLENINLSKDEEVEKIIAEQNHLDDN